jgi:ABC-type amino acid transport substrate-binding protein
MFLRSLLPVLLLSFVYGNAFSSNVQVPLNVNIYAPQLLDKQGIQVPVTPERAAMLNYFEQTANLKFSIITLPWKRAQLEVAQGKGIVYGFSKSTERLDQYRFSLPVVTLNMWAISHGEANSHLSKVSDLQGKIITSGLGLSHGIEYELAKNTIFTVEEDMLPPQHRYKRLVSKSNYLMLMPARQDLTRAQLIDFVNNTVVPQFNDPELNNKHFDISLKPLFYDTIHFASGKGHFDDVIDRIDKAIVAGTKNGSLPKLLRKYK